MLRVFAGENRGAAEVEIRRVLGEDYEVFEGETLMVGDLPSIFRGTTLFAVDKRQILLKNVSENTAVWEKLAEYKDTEDEAIAWELKLDKRLTGYKVMKDAGVEIKEFPLLQAPESRAVFGILDLALRDGALAVKEVEKIEVSQDPYMFFGLLVTQTLKKYEVSGGAMRERNLVKLLAETDMQMKGSGMEPWDLIKSLLLRFSSLGEFC